MLDLIYHNWREVFHLVFQVTSTPPSWPRVRATASGRGARRWRRRSRVWSRRRARTSRRSTSWRRGTTSRTPQILWVFLTVFNSAESCSNQIYFRNLCFSAVFIIAIIWQNDTMLKTSCHLILSSLLSHFLRSDFGVFKTWLESSYFFSLLSWVLLTTSLNFHSYCSVIFVWRVFNSHCLHILNVCIPFLSADDHSKHVRGRSQRSLGRRNDHADRTDDDQSPPKINNREYKSRKLFSSTYSLSFLLARSLGNYPFFLLPCWVEGFILVSIFRVFETWKTVQIISFTIKSVCIQNKDVLGP